MLPILYRDERLIAIHKPAGLLVHRSEIDRHETRFAVQMLRDQIGQHVYAAHRLDKGTSGILLFALDKDAAREMGALFEQQKIDKTYLAVVRGHPPAAGRIDHALTRQRDDREWRGDRAGAEAQSAVTDYRTLANVELPVMVDRYPASRYALMALSPLTGRRHQLRRHLKHIAHPIIGDATYGKGVHNRYFAEHLDSRRMLLACVETAFTHPYSGERLTLRAPLDGDFAGIVRRFAWEATLAEGWLSPADGAADQDPPTKP
ncbi:tRNA pseudouridine(65) synthase TruC [uncultured Aquitalea sp.]|uniref:tRNA pseudouridine(65) synthase TruC n=1 Tax=uncultured Aquitalea sp. TaxID=540272 RepID=UPI0025ECFC69|nr:tRNA pseudouridine(65) synthase TruC [uncultured Aquitalea sp.]